MTHNGIALYKIAAKKKDKDSSQSQYTDLSEKELKQLKEYLQDYKEGESPGLLLFTAGGRAGYAADATASEQRQDAINNLKLNAGKLLGGLAGGAAGYALSGDNTLNKVLSVAGGTIGGSMLGKYIAYKASTAGTENSDMPISTFVPVAGTAKALARMRGASKQDQNRYFRSGMSRLGGILPGALAGSVVGSLISRSTGTDPATSRAIGAVGGGILADILDSSLIRQQSKYL